MGRLEIDPFLTQLAALFKKTRNSGSVFVTMKKVSVTQTPRRRKNKDTERPEDCCLIRVQGPSGTKFSTIIRSRDVVKFQVSYNNMLKVYTDGLKTRTPAGIKKKIVKKA